MLSRVCLTVSPAWRRRAPSPPGSRPPRDLSPISASEESSTPEEPPVSPGLYQSPPLYASTPAAADRKPTARRRTRGQAAAAATAEPEDATRAAEEDEAERDTASKRRRTRPETPSTPSLFRSLLSEEDMKSLGKFSVELPPNASELEEELIEESRTDWSEGQKADGFVVSPDNLTVSFASDGAVPAAVIQASSPVDRKSKEIAYFEIELLEDDIRPVKLQTYGVYVGLSSAVHPLDTQLGFHPESVGYCQDGRRFTGLGYGRTVSAPFVAGDVIGCGVRNTSGHVFFTRNGRYQGAAAQFDIHSLFSLYPSVGLTCPENGCNVKFRLNWGHKPFRFDLTKKAVRQLPVQDVHFAGALQGLLVDGIPLPLKAAAVRPVVAGFGAEVTLTQEFYNYYERSVDGVFAFPIDNLDTLMRFRAEYDGKQIWPQVQDRPLGSGERDPDGLDLLLPVYNGAQLKFPTLFARLAAIPPRSNIKVTVTYYSHIRDSKGTGDTVGILLPTTMAPSQSVNWMENVFDPEFKELALPFMSGGLMLRMQVYFPDQLRDIHSDRHKINTEFEYGQFNRKATVKGDFAYLTADLVVHLVPKYPHQPHGLLEYDAATDTLACLVAFWPGEGTRFEEVEFDWKAGFECETFSQVPPTIPLWDDAPFDVYSVLHACSQRSGKVTMLACNRKPYDIECRDLGTGDLIHRLAAKASIRIMSLALDENKEDEYLDEIIELAKEYKLLSTRLMTHTAMFSRDQPLPGVPTPKKPEKKTKRVTLYMAPAGTKIVPSVGAFL